MVPNLLQISNVQRNSRLAVQSLLTAHWPPEIPKVSLNCLVSGNEHLLGSLLLVLGDRSPVVPRLPLSHPGNPIPDHMLQLARGETLRIGERKEKNREALYLIIK